MNSSFITTRPGLTTYDLSSLYTTLLHNLIKEKLKMPFLLLNNLNDINCGHVRKCVMLHYLLVNIFMRFGSKLYRQIEGIPMGTNCAPLVADLFLFCYERDTMLSDI